MQKEWDKLIKRETAFLSKKGEKQQTKLNALLEEKIPDGLQDTLDNAFGKAFNLVFSKGTGVIEKTYNKEKARETAFINHTLASKRRPSRKSLKTINKTAGKSGNLNLAVSSVTGVGLGVLGIGIPDIVIFVAMILKSLYQIATDYGIDYNKEKERRFILLLIQGAVTFGDEQEKINKEIDHFIEYGYFKNDESLEDCIENCAESLSGELLYMKFLQGIPLVGAVGGAYDFVYMKQINEYARIKYYKRFLSDKLCGL